MDCYDAIDLMGDALDGRLEMEKRAGFDEHLQECVICRTYLDQLRVTVGALGHLPRSKLSNRLKQELIKAFKRERHHPSS